MKARQFTFLILITILTCAFVWVRLRIVSIGYEIHELENHERSAVNACNQLRVKINEAKSPKKLEQLARTKFDMQPPAPNQTIVLR